MSLPLALSNTSCFPEIAGDAAVYFDPYSISSMSEAITKVIYNEEKRSQLIRLGNERLKRYSWEKSSPENRRGLPKSHTIHENNVKSYIYEWTNT